jgi:hypothetical protein
MPNQLQYRLPQEKQWKASNHVIAALNARKHNTHIHQIVNVQFPAHVRHPMTEEDLIKGVLTIMKPKSREYKKKMSDERVIALCTSLGEEGQARIRQNFNKFLDGLEPNGRTTHWKLQEQGKIPLQGAFLFYVQLSGLRSLGPGHYLQQGQIEKKTHEGIIDPVKDAKPLAPYDGDVEHRYRFLCICGTHVFLIGTVNGKECHGEDTWTKVTKTWQQFDKIYQIPIAIFDGTYKEAHEFALFHKDIFRARRCMYGPARTLMQLEEWLTRRPEWSRPPSMASATPADFLNILFGSQVKIWTGELRTLSYAIYVNPDENLIEMSYGQNAKLCHLFAKNRKKAKEIGEAVVTIKQSNGDFNELMLVFPFGIELALAMRPPNRPAHRHSIVNSGESSATDWLTGDYYQGLYHEFNRGNQEGIPLSQLKTFSIIPAVHAEFTLTRRINVPERLEQRDLCILSVDDDTVTNYCLVNSEMKTVSSAIVPRKQSRKEVLTVLEDAFENMKYELAAIDLNALRKDVDFQSDEELFTSLDDLIAVCRPDRRFKRQRLV